MTIDELLKSDNPEKYDLKNEMQYSSKGGRSLNLMLEYKNSRDGFDCDGTLINQRDNCKLIRIIYRELWGWEDLDDGGKIKRYGGISTIPNLLFSPETMNSFKTTYKFIVDNKSQSPSDENVDLFAESVGRIGNMTLTIQGLNKYIALDYWDIKISRLYINDERSIIPSNFSSVRYVNYFFQWDYVLHDNDCYKTKLFWKNHDQKYKPRALTEIETFIRLVDSYTKRRGSFMVALLKVKQLNKDVFYSIMNNIINTDIVYNGFEDVIMRIMGFLEANNALLNVFRNSVEPYFPNIIHQ